MVKAPSYKISAVTGGLAALIFAFSGLFVHDGAVAAPWSGGGAVESTAQETAPAGADAAAEDDEDAGGEAEQADDAHKPPSTPEPEQSAAAGQDDAPPDTEPAAEPAASPEFTAGDMIAGFEESITFIYDAYNNITPANVRASNYVIGVEASDYTSYKLEGLDNRPFGVYIIEYPNQMYYIARLDLTSSPRGDIAKVYTAADQLVRGRALDGSIESYYIQNGNNHYFNEEDFQNLLRESLSGNGRFHFVTGISKGFARLRASVFSLDDKIYMDFYITKESS